VEADNVTSFLARSLAVASMALLVVTATGGVASAQTVSSDRTPAETNQLAVAALNAEAAAVAQYLEISPEQLQSELYGRSLAQVARLHGKTTAEITTVVVDTAHQQIDLALNEGQLTPEEAFEYKRQVVKYAPLMVMSEEASAFALGAVANDCVEAC
jgi:phage I-like protein